MIDFTIDDADVLRANLRMDEYYGVGGSAVDDLLENIGMAQVSNIQDRTQAGDDWADNAFPEYSDAYEHFKRQYGSGRYTGEPNLELDSIMMPSVATEMDSMKGTVAVSAGIEGADSHQSDKMGWNIEMGRDPMGWNPDDLTEHFELVKDWFDDGMRYAHA